MSARTTRYSRVLSLFMGCVALSLAVTRCSPLSPSISKFRSASTTTGTGGDSGMLGAVGNALPVAKPQAASTLRSTPAEVLELGTYETEVSRLPKEMKVTLSSESHPELFAAFKEQPMTFLQFEGTPPDECHVYLGLSMSQAKIEERELDQLKAVCAPVADGMWKLSIPLAGDESKLAWTWIESGLQSVTVYVTNHPQMKVVSVDSAPQVAVPAQGPEGRAATVQ